VLEEVIRGELSALCPGQNVRESAVFRIARDAELELDDEGGHDFLRAVEEELRNRRRSEIVRLEVEAQAGDPLLADLSPRLGVSAEDLYRIPGPLDIRAFSPLPDL